MKTLWYLGKDTLASEAEALAEAIDATLVDSSQAEAIPEQVWVEQIFDPGARSGLLGRLVTEVVVVVYIDNNDYDVEGTIHRILYRSQKTIKILYLYPENPSDNLLDGFTHFDGVDIHHAVIGTKTLAELYNET